MTEFPQLDSGLDVLMFTQGDDLIAYLNKAMAFLSAVAALRFPSTNNQLRTSSNLRNQATIQDGRVTVQQVQKRQGQSYAGTGYKIEDLDAYDSDCDDVSNAKAVLMGNLSNCGSDVISEVPNSESYHNDMDNQNFGKNFVPQQELSPGQAFWLQTSHPNTDQYDISPVKIKAPRELPKVSLVNTSLKKLKYHLGKFDTVVKKRNTPDAITEGEWGFEHTKAVFLNEIISFLNTLKDIFNVFDKDLLNEDKSCDNQNALEIPGYFENNDLKAQLQAKDTTIRKLKEHIKSMRENDKKEKVKQDMDEIETINIELEQRYFENNDLKAQLQAKDTTIRKLKEHIKSMRENDKKEKVKQDMDEIETINIELEQSVAKSLSENELLHKEIKHLKKIYKDQFDSIKNTHALLKNTMTL
nr:hypothetical protein [Tanacetum cinerariifolium]